MKDVIISITGVQDLVGDDSSIELVTEGKYSYKDGCGQLHYMESELTGMKGTQTCISFSPKEVVIDRRGMYTGHMVFRKGSKSTFLYDTPYGSATMGIDTHDINLTLGPRGGGAEVDYVIGLEHSMISRNRFIVNVREQTRPEP